MLRRDVLLKGNDNPEPFSPEKVWKTYHLLSHESKIAHIGFLCIYTMRTL